MKKNFNITVDDARFIVCPEKRKVVCIIDNTAWMFKDYAKWSLHMDTWYLEKIHKGINQRFTMPRRFVGVATCSPDDVFNEETGKLIAFSRAKDKLHTSFFKRANLYVNTMDDWLSRTVEGINLYGEKLERHAKRRQKKIDELVGVEE